MIETIAPLNPDLLKDHISKMSREVNRTAVYIIDPDESLIKGPALLNYIGNLRLCVVLKEDTKLGTKKELVKEYLSSRLPQAVNNITEEVGIILLTIKGAAIPDGFFTVEERKEFIKDNMEVLREWEKFLDSIPYMAPFVFGYYRETVGKTLLSSGGIKTVDNPLLVSPNALNLFYMDGFIENYLSRVARPLARMYKYLFYSPCFERKGMIEVLQEQTTLVPFMHSLEKPNANQPVAHDAV